VPFPPRRVGGVAPGKVEHRFDSAPDAARGFRFLRPNRFKHLKHRRGIDCLNVQSPECRQDVLAQGASSLRAVDRVFPVVLVLLEISLGRVRERQPLGLSLSRGGP
jgi:hypothetical protein